MIDQQKLFLVITRIYYLSIRTCIFKEIKREEKREKRKDTKQRKKRDIAKDATYLFLYGEIRFYVCIAQNILYTYF